MRPSSLCRPPVRFRVRNCSLYLIDEGRFLCRGKPRPHDDGVVPPGQGCGKVRTVGEPPLPAGPRIIENTTKSGVALPRILSSGLSASISWLIVMSFQGSAPPQAPPTHRKSLRYDFRITMVRQLEMKRRKEEIILRKKI